VSDYPYEHHGIGAFAYKNNKMFPDGYLGITYFECKNQDILKWGMPGLASSMDDFIAFFHSKAILFPLMEKTDEGWKTIGLAWIDAIDGVEYDRRAMIGFMFYRKTPYWKTEHATWMGLKCIFDTGKLRILQGVQLLSNPVANRHSRKFGFDDICILPSAVSVKGELKDARLVSLTAEKFDKIFGEWAETAGFNQINPVR